MSPEEKEAIKLWQGITNQLLKSLQKLEEKLRNKLTHISQDSPVGSIADNKSMRSQLVVADNKTMQSQLVQAVNEMFDASTQTDKKLWTIDKRSVLQLVMVTVGILTAILFLK